MQVGSAYQNKILNFWGESAEGGNRTPTDRSPVDFESTASTNFTTSAKSSVKLKF